jgi:hypothetical protein
MGTIWKFPIPGWENEVKAPGLGRLLHVAMQHGTPTLWAEVNEDAPIRRCTVNMCGTGHDRPSGDYIGTVFDQQFVWHYYATPVTS